MNKLDFEINERAAVLEDIIKNINKLTARKAKGRLRVSTCKGYPQYRICTDENDKRGKYVNKYNLQRARSIAQRDYLLKLKKYAEKELKIIKQLQQNRIDTIEDIYDKQVNARKVITTPLVLSDIEYAKVWQEMEYHHKYIDTGYYRYITFKGETVRSKSEVIIANILFLLGIPYKYEYPLILPNGRTIYVDFLILDVKNRKEIWYEHFGMMGIVWYADDNTERFNNIVSAGLIPGDNFIATFETENKVLDTETILKIFEPYRTNDDYIDLKKIAEEAESFD